MFGPKYVQGCMFAFVLCTLLSGIIDGVFLGSMDYGVVETLTNWSAQGFGGWGVPLAVPFVFASFILALPEMLVWDYSFFHELGAAGGIMRLVLFATISIGFVWGFFTVLFPAILNFMANLARGIFGLFRL